MRPPAMALSAQLPQVGEPEPGQLALGPANCPRAGAATSDPQATALRTRGSVRDLPDLTGRLIKEGLHEEYLRYRERYLTWRQGGAAGAVGELSWVGTDRSPNQEERSQELWHPTPQKFDFFYTVSYWVAILSEVGALLLLVKDVAQLAMPEDWTRRRKGLFSMVTLVGDLYYTASAYFAYFELINIPETGRVFYLFPTWGPVRERVSSESLIGVAAYLLGMLLWDVPTVTLILGLDSPSVVAVLLQRLPTLLGGIGFCVGGVCELIHNWSRSMADVEWWISRLNAFAGVGFAVGGACGMFPATAFITGYCTSLGLAVYVVTGVLLMVMWRGNDFGLTLLRQLNASLRAGSHIFIAPTADGVCIRHANPNGGRHQAADSSGQEGNRGRLSMRGVVFLALYCWLFACTTMNCLAVMYADSTMADHLLKLAGGLLWMVVVAIVLTIHSSVTSVPNQQPYRAAMLAMRGVLFGASVLQTLVLSRWLCHLQHPGWDHGRGSLLAS